MPDPLPNPLPPVRHPARFVPLSAIAIGDPGEVAVSVGPANPIPSREQPLRGARSLAADTPIAAGLALLVDCSAGGQSTFTLEDGSSLSLTLAPGLTLLPLAVTNFSAADLTASFNAWVLD